MCAKVVGGPVLRSAREIDSVDRGMAVTGSAAIEWMDQLGYEIPDRTARFRAGGDAIRGRTFAVSRLWHDAPAVIRRAEQNSGGGAISIVVEGTIRVTQGATTIEIVKGEGFVDSLSSATTIEVDSAVGTIELRVNTSFAQRFGVAIVDRLQPLNPTLGTIPGLVTLANATLASHGQHRGSSWAFTRAALENLVAALMVEANEPPTDSILERALEEIRLSSADPAFSVTALAATQKMTSRWLQAAFAERGLTPRQAIRLERTRQARQLMEIHRDIPLDEVAQRAGFPSVRALREALRAIPETTR